MKRKPEEAFAWTPMFRQYRGVKEQYPGVMVLFRLGDFYEMFGEDAQIASRELELTLTSREIGKGNRVPMCGVPHHAVERYLAQLIGKGYKCALCDQAEDARLAKGLVNREVTRVVSAGTVVEDAMLPDRSNNFLAAVHQIDETIGLALIDISTGEFLLTEMTGEESAGRLVEELMRWQVAECLAEKQLLDNLRTRVGNRGWKCAWTQVEAHPLTSLSPEAQLCAQFGVHSLRGFGLEPGTHVIALQAAAIALNYLKQTHLPALAHLQPPRLYSFEQYMMLDAATRRNLELTHSLRDGSSRGTLLELLDQTETAMGGRLLRRWLHQPLNDVAAIEQRLECVQHFHQDPLLRGDLRQMLGSVSDLERLTGRAATAMAGPRDLTAMRRSLEVVPAIRELLRASGRPSDFQENLDDLPDLKDLLTRALNDDPPHTIADGGIIRDGFDAQLDELRQASREGKNWIAALEERERQRTGIRSLKVGYNQVFGYYLEITRAHLKQAPQDYHRKQTLANAERFITPELKEVEAKVLGAEEKIAALEAELFRSVRESVAREAQRLLATAHALAELDVFSTLAEVVARNHYIRPEVDDGDTVQIDEGRHPVVEQTQYEPFVPNDARLDCEENQILILTGPNMAGKSTYLRQVALTVLMAQIGCFVPAKRARLGIVDRIFTRIGAQDDLATGQSTFMVEMTETANILHHATVKSLVILDEIGRGTSTFDGLSIAWAVVEALHERKCKTLFATHYHHLNQLEEQLPRVRNFRIAVKEEGEKIIFLRRIVRGGTDRSYGIQVARLAGLPPSVIERAKQVLWTLEQERDLGRIEPDGNLLREAAKPLQLTLFEAHPVERELRLIEVDTLTPMEAINKLYEIKRKLDSPGPEADHA